MVGSRTVAWEGRPITPETLRRLDEVRRFVMQGRTLEDDSADLIRVAREERLAELGAHGWWLPHPSPPGGQRRPPLRKRPRP